jgi:hypothetical protein
MYIHSHRACMRDDGLKLQAAHAVSLKPVSAVHVC